MVAPPDFSALYCPPRTGDPTVKEKMVLSGWTVEGLSKNPSHLCFNPAAGEYTVSVDGLYSLIVELIPIGSVRLEYEQNKRAQVEYALRITEPDPEQPDQSDHVESEFLDVGPINLGQMKHLRTGNVISCLCMPPTLAQTCVRLKIACIQRKKKRPRPVELSKKEQKKRKKMKRKAESIASSLSSGMEVSSSKPCPGSSDTSRAHESSEDDNSDSEWSNGFESDTTEDNLPHSARGVGRLAKRFKSSAGPHPA